MILEDDTPALGTFPNPYPKNQPIRHILNTQYNTVMNVIVFEGPDGAGKSTQLRMLAARLEQEQKKVTIGKFIKSPLIQHILPKSKWENCDPYTSALIYTTALTDLVNQIVLPALAEGHIILLDRYVYSIMTRALVRGCQRKWVRGLLSHINIPHLVINLHTPISLCLERKRSDKHYPSYWECGIDIFGDDQLRTTVDTDEYDRCFVLYQQAMQDELLNLLPQHLSQIVSNEGDSITVHNEIWQRIRPILG